MLNLAIEPAKALAKMGLGALGLPLASAALGAGLGVPGPSPADAGWNRMPQQGAAWALILGHAQSRAAYLRTKEVQVMGGKGKMILWRPFQYAGNWYATARLAQKLPPSQNPMLLYAYGTAAQTPGPMALGAVPGSAVNNALHPTLRLDEHGVVTHKSLFGMSAPGSAAVLDQSLRKWGQLPVQPSPSSPNWGPLSASDLTLLQAQVGWAEAVSNAKRLGETMFRFRGSWYLFSGANGFKVLGGGSGSGGHRSLAGTGIGQVNPNFKPVTASDLNATAAGIPLQQAAMALNALLANGVPDEHVYNATVYAFQVAYNADPVSDIENDAAGNGKLNEDGEYGPNTQAAYGAIMAISAPAPNPGPAPGPTPAPTPTPLPGTSRNYTVPVVAGVLILAAGGVGYAAYHHKKTKHHPAHA